MATETEKTSLEQQLTSAFENAGATDGAALLETQQATASDQQQQLSDTSSSQADSGDPQQTATTTEGDGGGDGGQQQEFVSTALLEKLKAQGVDVSQYKSDDDIAKSWINQRELIGRQSKYVNLGRALEENPQAVVAKYAPHLGYVPAASIQQFQQPQHSQQQEKPLTPALLNELNKAVVRDENGLITGVKPGYNPADAVRLRELEERGLQTQQEFLVDPDNFIKSRASVPQDQIREIVAREIEERMAVASEERKAVEFYEEHKDWLIDPATQQLSVYGRDFYQFMQEGMQIGINEKNTDGLVKYARAQLLNKYGYRQQPTQTKQTPSKAISKGNMSAPNRVKGEGEYLPGESLEDALNRNLLGIVKK